MAAHGATDHIRFMDADGGHHYTVEVRPSQEAPGCYRWLIRDRGKLFRASYRPHASEDAARAIAAAEVERLAGPDNPH